MKTNKFKFLVVLITALLLVHCVKETSGKGENDELKNLLLRQNGWQIYSQFVDPPVFVRGMEISDFTKLFEPCEFYSIVKFIDDPEKPPIKMVEFYGVDSCDPAEPPYVISTIDLQLNNDPPGFLGTNTDTGETLFWEIVRLDDLSLIIKATNGEKTFTDEFVANL
ncbi:MAG: hypothetical protein KDC80_22030 [Saprospiraceae bacterium]|nr:hypothetical protein [Saprospiraceae bacterium]